VIDERNQTAASRWRARTRAKKPMFAIAVSDTIPSADVSNASSKPLRRTRRE